MNSEQVRLEVELAGQIAAERLMHKILAGGNGGGVSPPGVVACGAGSHPAQGAPERASAPPPVRPLPCSCGDTIPDPRCRRHGGLSEAEAMRRIERRATYTSLMDALAVLRERMAGKPDCESTREDRRLVHAVQDYARELWGTEKP